MKTPAVIAVVAVTLGVWLAVTGTATSMDCGRAAATQARQADHLNSWEAPEPTPGHCDVIGSWP